METVTRQAKCNTYACKAIWRRKGDIKVGNECNFVMMNYPICKRNISVCLSNWEKKRVADQLRLGSLTEDGTSYKEKFIVRCYQVGINKTATVETIAKLLQEVSCNQVQSLGISEDGIATTLTMRKLHLIWVTCRMHIEIYKYPTWNDVVEIETWMQGQGRIGLRGDWLLKDFANGEIIGWATCKWVMMNQHTKRVQKLCGHVRDEFVEFLPKTPGLAFPEANKRNIMMKIPKLKDPCHFSKLRLMPRRSDLDMNLHVNNVTYIGWVLESIPQQVIDTHELQSMTLDYRHECQHEDVVDSLTSPQAIEDANGSTNFFHFLHLLKLSHHDGLEISRGRTVWRKKSLIN